MLPHVSLLLLFATVVLVWRLWRVWPRMNGRMNFMRGEASRATPVRTCYVMGAGGHTGELLPLVKSMDIRRYSPRLYVVGVTDRVSGQRVEVIEGTRSDYSVTRIPRGRDVGQSYVTSLFTSLQAVGSALWIVFTWQPELIVCNGPAICIPMALASLALRVARGASASRVVFIESGCRVTSLSLTGKLMYHLWLCDAFLVQWERLKDTAAPRSVYMGRTL
jgi:beta-1,4-N-acetylglucosaminyltransferase